MALYALALAWVAQHCYGASSPNSHLCSEQDHVDAPGDLQSSSSQPGCLYSQKQVTSRPPVALRTEHSLGGCARGRRSAGAAGARSFLGGACLGVRGVLELQGVVLQVVSGRAREAGLVVHHHDRRALQEVRLLRAHSICHAQNRRIPLLISASGLWKGMSQKWSTITTDARSRKCGFCARTAAVRARVAGHHLLISFRSVGRDDPKVVHHHDGRAHQEARPLHARSMCRSQNWTASGQTAGPGC